MYSVNKRSAKDTLVNSEVKSDQKIYIYIVRRNGTVRPNNLQQQLRKCLTVKVLLALYTNILLGCIIYEIE